MAAFGRAYSGPRGRNGRADAHSDGRRVNWAQNSPEICTELYQPVCGTDQNGMRKTYSNACFARMAKATNVTPGECPK